MIMYGYRYVVLISSLAIQCLHAMSGNVNNEKIYREVEDCRKRVCINLVFKQLLKLPSPFVKKLIDLLSSDFYSSEELQDSDFERYKNKLFENEKGISVYTTNKNKRIDEIIFISPDESCIAFGNSHQIVCWDITKKKRITSLGGGKYLTFSPVCNQFAYVDSHQNINLVDALSCKMITQHYLCDITALSYNPCKPILAVGQSKGNVTLFNVSDTLKEIKELTTIIADSNPIFSFAFSPDGNTLAFNSRGNINFVDLSGNIIKASVTTLERCHNFVYQISYNPNNKKQFVSYGDQCIKVWEFQELEKKPKIINQIKLTVGAYSLLFSPSKLLNKLILSFHAYGEHKLELFTDSLNQKVGTINIYPNALAFSPKDKKLAVASGGTITLLEFRYSQLTEYLNSLTSNDIKKTKKCLFLCQILKHFDKTKKPLNIQQKKEALELFNEFPEWLKQPLKKNGLV